MFIPPSAPKYFPSRIFTESLLNKFLLVTKSGLKLILNNLDALFEREQVKYVDCVGKTFDHTIHHAISTVEKENCIDGEIIEEAKKGYYLGEKLLRPSQVIVAKKKV